MWLKCRRGVSELLATLMMIGVTLSFGGYITYAAIGQFNLAQNSASLAAAVQQQSAGKLISLVYSAVTQSGSCPVYGGYNEGSLTLELYNYGTVSFTPSEAFINGTLYSGAGSIAASSMGAFSFASPSCVHPSGQTILLVDSYGDEVQIGT
jgi:flagellin-like protein